MLSNSWATLAKSIRWLWVRVQKFASYYEHSEDFNRQFSIDINRISGEKKKKTSENIQKNPIEFLHRIISHSIVHIIEFHLSF